MVGEGKQPLVCTPLVGKTRDAILAELHHIVDKEPDLIEWRADYFGEIANLPEAIVMAKQIVENKGNIPVIFTLRSKPEGGLFEPSSPEERLAIIAAVCEGSGVAYVDYELSNPPEQIRKLRLLTEATNTKIITSFHDFNRTPPRETLLEKVAAAKAYGADVVKIAVMPNCLEDVLILLGVTLEAKKIVDIPVITVSMGACGLVSRLLGGIFGSAVTFAVGHGSSAPGQIPIEDLKTVLGIVNKTMNNKI